MTTPALAHPGLVVPDVGRGIGHDGCGGRRSLGRTRQRIGLQRQARAIRPHDGVFVSRARCEAGNEQLPHAGRKSEPHRMAARVPAVEVADDRHRTRVRRPDGEAHAAHAVDRHDAGAKMLGELEMPPFVEQVEVKLAQQRAEGIRVFGLLHRARPGDAQQIGLRAVHPADEQPKRRHRRQPSERGAACARQHLGLQCARQEGTHDAPHRGVVRTQHAEWIAQRSIGHCSGHARRQAWQIDHIVHDRTFSPINCVTSCASPCSGTSIQVGRLAAS